MSSISLIKDKAFLRKLDESNLKVYYVKINVLDDNEIYLDSIEGRISTGSISIDGNSSIRRTGNLTFIYGDNIEEDSNYINELLTTNKRIQVYIGVQNNIDPNYEDIIWFNQGVYLISSMTISHAASGINVSLKIKDKMCLLNGEMGGMLPAGITLDSYEQEMGFKDCGDEFPTVYNDYTVYKVKGAYYRWANGHFEAVLDYDESDEYNQFKIMTFPHRFFDIIQTLVCNYGNESTSKIIIEDVPLQIKAHTKLDDGFYQVYFNNDYENPIYTTEDKSGDSSYTLFNPNEFFGYRYEDFVITGELKTSIGETICSALDKIKNLLGNFEYFYDLNGNFVFREVKNYLNMQYDPVQTEDKTYTLNDRGYVLDDTNYYVDLSNTSEQVYDFEKNSPLIVSFNNTPDFSNVKNDFHIWGKLKNGNTVVNSIHYHLAIKSKPEKPYRERTVYFYKEYGEYTGKIRLVRDDDYDKETEAYVKETILNYKRSDTLVEEPSTLFLGKNAGKVEGTTLILDEMPCIVAGYIPEDWRAEIYLRGLEKKARQQRPDIYEEEIIDLLPTIYDFSVVNKDKGTFGEFKNIGYENLTYWVDYIDPAPLHNFLSIDVIGSKIKSYQQDNITRIYDAKIPNIIIIGESESEDLKAEKIAMAKKKNLAYAIVSDEIYQSSQVSDYGFSAESVARELLYQYSDILSSISFQSIPIYYLDVNSRISVYDDATNIYGDYIIKNITMPLDSKNTMNVTASRVLKRI